LPIAVFGHTSGFKDESSFKKRPIADGQFAAFIEAHRPTGGNRPGGCSSLVFARLGKASAAPGYSLYSTNK
jgi:hypothetical protein